jgi:hypothetical protein
MGQQAAAHAGRQAAGTGHMNYANVPPGAASALRTRLMQGNPAQAVDPNAAKQAQASAAGHRQQFAARQPQRVRLMDEAGNVSPDAAEAARYRARGIRPKYAASIDGSNYDDSTETGLQTVLDSLPMNPMIRQLLISEIARRTGRQP